MDFKERVEHELDFTKRKMHPCRVTITALGAMTFILCATAGIVWVLAQIVAALGLRGY